MKKFLTLFLALPLALSGCSKKADAAADASQGSPKAKQADKVKVGYCINNFNDTFQTYIYEACKAYFEKNAPDIEFLNADAMEDMIKQQDRVNDLISQGVKALIVVPVDTSAMSPVTKAAKEAGIPLCYVNRNPYGESDPPEGVYYVGSMEVMAGEMQMEYIGEKLGGKGGVAILQGILSNEGAQKRTQGNENVISKKYPGIEVLAKETGNWQRDQGLDKTNAWLSAFGGRLNAVLANNDEMALGAVRALEEAGRKDVLVIGVDGISDAITAIERGELTGSVLQDGVGQGEGAAKSVIAALSGQKPQPITWIPFQLITPENVADFK